MKPDTQKFRFRPHQELFPTQQTQGNPVEFNAAEEMIRYDAAQTPVPEPLESRVRDSVAREPKPSRSWWKRLFGGG